MTTTRWMMSVGAAATLLATAGGVMARPAAPALSLSLFKPDGKGITWIRQDALAPQKRTVIARFAQANVMPQTAWRADAKQALVWLTRNDENGASTLWSVDVDKHRVSKLTLPTHGRIHDFGYDKQGRALVLTLHEVPVRKDKAGSHFQFQNKRYTIDTDSEGLPVLAIAYRLSPKGTWDLIETTVSDTGWDMALGVDKLKASSLLGYRTTHELRSTSRGDDEDDKTVVALLTAAVPEVKQFEGEWIRMESSAGPFYIWGEFVEFIFSSPIVAVKSGGKWAKLPGLTDDFEFSPKNLNFIAPQVRDHYLLATHSYDGKHPHLYDLKTAKLLYQDPSAVGAVFWPQ